jgi:Tol biopolymer transport system component
VKRSMAFVVMGLLWTVSLAPTPAANAAFPGANGDIAFSRFTQHQIDIWIVAPDSTSTVRLTNTRRANEGMPDSNVPGTRVAFSKCGRGNSDGSGQTQLTMTSGIFDAFPEWSPDSNKIAFTSDRMDFDDIWVIDADGSNPTRLTSGPKIDERPDWSPDATRIAFSRNGNIWTMDADGTDLTKLTENRRHEFAPAFSPDGTRIAFNKEGANGRFGVWIILVDGSSPEQQTFGLSDFFPDWQPV